MSGYNYPGTGQNGQQQFNQYNFQQYSPQGYPQLNTSQQAQYSNPLQHSSQHAMSFGNVQGLPQHHVDAEVAAGYQDFASVYNTHDSAFSSARPSYSSHHVTNGQHAPYPQAASTGLQHLQQQQQISVPLPLPIPVQNNHVAKVHPHTIQTQDFGKAATAGTPPTKKIRSTGKRGANFSKKTNEWEAENGSDGDEYNMDGMKTKSGRKVHKPSQFNPSTKTPSKKRGAPGKKIVLDSLFCKVCDRGHSPKSNLIVFCDGCNTPYHQLCHIPVIDNLLITLPDAEWFCSICDERRGQQKLEMGYDGAGLSEDEKKTYLASLPVSHLVQLIMHASASHPELGLFSPTAAATLEDKRQKQLTATLAEQAKLVTPIYQPVVGDDILAIGPVDQIMEDRIITAVTKLNRPVLNRDIIEHIESHHLVNPMDFRVKCAEQISQSVKRGRLEKEGPHIVLPGMQKPSATTSINSQAFPGDKTSARITGGVSTSANATGVQGLTQPDEQYPPVVGIRLPAQSAENDGFVMNETESPAFKHIDHTVGDMLGSESAVQNGGQ